MYIIDFVAFLHTLLFQCILLRVESRLTWLYYQHILKYFIVFEWLAGCQFANFNTSHIGLFICSWLVPDLSIFVYMCVYKRVNMHMPMCFFITKSGRWWNNSEWICRYLTILNHDIIFYNVQDPWAILSNMTPGFCISW